MKVLLVEDDVRLATLVAGALRREAMAVDVAFDGQDALDQVAAADYDVVVLDRALPRGARRRSVCRSLVSRRCPSRILMVTAADAIEDRVAGLSIGADDYLPKPFAMAELAARIRALRPRRTCPARLRSWFRGDLRLALRPAGWLPAPARSLDLRPKEFAVLEMLLSAQGAVVTADELAEKVWDEMADPFTTTVRGNRQPGAC